MILLNSIEALDFQTKRKGKIEQISPTCIIKIIGINPFGRRGYSQFPCFNFVVPVKNTFNVKLGQGNLK